MLFCNGKADRAGITLGIEIEEIVFQVGKPLSFLLKFITLKRRGVDRLLPFFLFTYGDKRKKNVILYMYIAK